MATRAVHTVPRDGGWENIREDSDQVLDGQHTTKAEAQSSGRDIAKADGVEHIVHNQDGQIGERNSYGNDPYPPRG